MSMNDETDVSVEPPALTPIEQPRAWIVAYGELGLINVVADSQEELVERFEKMRGEAVGLPAAVYAGFLRPIQVLPNNPDAPEVVTIWISPLLIQAVLEEFVPRREPTRAEPGLPSGLEALLAKVGAEAGENAEVFVVEGGGGDE